MKPLLAGLLLLVGKAQTGGWGNDLRQADTVWLDLPETAAWLERHRRAFDLREARTGLPCPKGFLTQAPSAKLLSLHATEKGLEWLWRIGEDTFLLYSRRVPIRQLQRHLVLLRGPCAKGPQEIEVMAVFQTRSKDLAEAEAALGWKPFLPEAWEKEIVAPLALPYRYSPAGITALGFVLRRKERERPFQLLEVRLYGRKSAFLPRDEVIGIYLRRRLPRSFLSRLRQVWQVQAPYGYVVRINDYYPTSVGEGVVWTKLLSAGNCLIPKELVDEEGHLRPSWEAELKKEHPPTLPLWQME